MAIYFELLQEELQTLIAESQKSEDLPKSDIPKDEIAMLCEFKVSPTQRLQQFYSLVLNHEEIRSHFLGGTEKNQKGKNLKRTAKFCDLVSSSVAKMIAVAPQRCLTEESLLFYKNKTLEELQHGNITDSVLLCVAPFHNYYTAEEILSCVSCLLKMPQESFVQEGELTSHGVLIETLIRTLLKKDQKVFLSRCSIDVLRDIVNLIQETNNKGKNHFMWQTIPINFTLSHFLD